MINVSAVQIATQFDLRTPTPSWIGDGPLTAKQLQGFLDLHLFPADRVNCKFYNDCQSFIDSENQNHENAVEQFCHSIEESDWGRSYIAHRKLQFRGYGCADWNPLAGAYSFKTVPDSIIKVSSYVVRDYLAEGGKYATPFTEEEFDRQLKRNQAWQPFIKKWREKRLRCTLVKPFTLECMNERYASDPNWDMKIAGLMRLFIEYLQENQTGGTP